MMFPALILALVFSSCLILRVRAAIVFPQNVGGWIEEPDLLSLVG
jgi:hypothetical protein